MHALLGSVIQAARNWMRGTSAFYALNALASGEKLWYLGGANFPPDYTPRMAGLDRFIAYDRPNFIGREAAIRDRETAPKRRLVTLAVASTDADAAGYEPIVLRGDLVVL